jgi:hypothetical protein
MLRAAAASGNAPRPGWLTPSHDAATPDKERSHGREQGGTQTIARDIATQGLQARGACASGLAMVHKKVIRAIRRSPLHHSRECLVAPEACGGALYWARETGRLGPRILRSRMLPSDSSS